MHSSAEELYAPHPDRSASPYELLSRITRAWSWDELFSSKEDEQADFRQQIVEAILEEHSGNGTLKHYEVIPDSSGEIHAITTVESKPSTIGQRLLRRIGIWQPKPDCTIQKYRYTKDVKINFNAHIPNSRTSLVTPRVGNIKHPFTQKNIIVPSDELLLASREEGVRMIAGDIRLRLATYLCGKPATKGWEWILLEDGWLPDRIGHRIIGRQALEAQARLMKDHPELFPGA